MSIKRKFGMGWVRDVWDERDILLRRQFCLADPITLPSKASVRAGCSPVENQGNLGSCTFNAIVGAYEFLELANPVSAKAFQDLSRLFGYYNERDAEGTINEDAGAQLRTGIKVLASLGVCRESLWPYDISKFATRPPQVCYDEGLLHKATTYQRMTKLDELKACIAGGLPFVGGWTVWSSAMTNAVMASGKIPMPSFWERRFKQPEGGHAVLYTAYDDATGLVEHKGSWGADKGDLGYFTQPYDYFNDTALSSDFWVLQKSLSDLFAFANNIEEVVV